MKTTTKIKAEHTGGGTYAIVKINTTKKVLAQFENVTSAGEKRQLGFTDERRLELEDFNSVNDAQAYIDEKLMLMKRIEEKRVFEVVVRPSEKTTVLQLEKKEKAKLSIDDFEKTNKRVYDCCLTLTNKQAVQGFIKQWADRPFDTGTISILINRQVFNIYRRKFGEDYYWCLFVNDEPAGMYFLKPDALSAIAKHY